MSGAFSLLKNDLLSQILSDISLCRLNIIREKNGSQVQRVKASALGSSEDNAQMSMIQPKAGSCNIIQPLGCGWAGGHPAASEGRFSARMQELNSPSAI